MDDYYENNEEIIKLKNNILSWYPFKKNARRLELNELKTEKYNGKFDYIIINDVKTNLSQYLEFCKHNLEENGAILITANNRFGLQNTKTNVNIQKDYNELLSKNQIEKILKEKGFNNYKFYYPLPNFKMANIIFTDESLPNLENIYRDLTLNDENDILTFDERNTYKDIIKYDVEYFKLFANSYIVEVSNNLQNNIHLVTFGNSRKEEYRMQTIITDEYAYKRNVTEKGKKHLENIKENIDILNKLDFDILDQYDEKQIISRLEKDVPTFDKILNNLCDEKKYDEFSKLVDEFINNICNKLKKDEVENTIFEKYDIEIDDEINQKLHYTKYGLYDLIFQNCFYKENKFFFFDQEWKERNVPIEFIVYRAIFYLINSRTDIDKNKLYERFKLTEYLQIFENLENKLQEQIKDKDIWGRHATNNIKVIDIYNKMVHYRNLKAQTEIELTNEKNKYEELLRQKENEINEKNAQIGSLTQELDYMKNSKSWKATKLLRDIRRKF